MYAIFFKSRGFKVQKYYIGCNLVMTKSKTTTKNIFQGSIFSGMNIFQDEYFQRWIFFRGVKFSGMIIYRSEHFSVVNMLSLAQFTWSSFQLYCIFFHVDVAPDIHITLKASQMAQKMWLLPSAICKGSLYMQKLHQCTIMIDFVYIAVHLFQLLTFWPKHMSTSFTVYLAYLTILCISF